MTYDIFYIIVACIVLLYVLANAIIMIIRKAKGQDKESRETLLQFTANLIESGVEIPKDLLVKILRGTISLDKVSGEISRLSSIRGK